MDPSYRYFGNALMLSEDQVAEAWTWELHALDDIQAEIDRILALILQRVEGIRNALIRVGIEDVYIRTRRNRKTGEMEVFGTDTLNLVRLQQSIIQLMKQEKLVWEAIPHQEAKRAVGLDIRGTQQLAKREGPTAVKKYVEKMVYQLTGYCSTGNQNLRFARTDAVAVGVALMKREHDRRLGIRND
jgi:hypothetical protein